MFWDFRCGAKKTEHLLCSTPRTEPVEMGWGRGEGWQIPPGV